MSKGKIVLGTLAGITAGAIAGVLLAPKKGSKTRNQIKEKGNEYYSDLKSKFNEFGDSVADKFDNTNKDNEKSSNNGKAKYGKMKKNA